MWPSQQLGCDEREFGCLKEGQRTPDTIPEKGNVPKGR